MAKRGISLQSGGGNDDDNEEEKLLKPNEMNSTLEWMRVNEIWTFSFG